ncbi:MAG: DUF3365 domain-containing protein [Gammaproteobacteria bacterium]|nr:DUF3365 domain-containing protein [Gammaproteobacteria bacterium]
MSPRSAAITACCVLAFSLLTACGQEATQVAAPSDSAPPATPSGNDADLARAQTAAQAFSSQLQQRLQGAMKDDGPVAAVDVCHTDAPAIAEAVMAEHGVRRGRVAAPGRNRNPAHAADDWRLETLQAFQQAVDDGAEAGEQVSVARHDLPDGVALRMMRGIATRQGCLACHGGAVEPDVREAIAARYPGDGATGFEVGDLRGALWVEVPAAQP